MRILITRHGETEENRLGIIQGHLDTKLSDLGWEQARKLAERLRDEKIDLIVSSDLVRAADTAREVARFHDCEVVFDERLRERFLGEFQGKNKGELLDSNADLIPIEDLRNKVEQDDSMLVRIENLFSELLDSDYKNILFIGHTGINKFLLATVAKDVALAKSKLKNTSLTVFEGDKGNFELKLLNCTRHLNEN